MVASAVQPPNRLALTNLETGEGWLAMFNPAGFTEEVTVNWVSQEVAGLSHQPVQYGSTSNHAFTLDLFFRASLAGGRGAGRAAEDALRQDSFRILGGSADNVPDKKPAGLPDIEAVRNFLLALAYPIQSTNVGGGGPPRVHVAWPNHMSMTCIVKGVRFRNSRFNQSGSVVEYTASVSFEEFRETRITSSEIRNLGTFRSED